MSRRIIAMKSSRRRFLKSSAALAAASTAALPAVARSARSPNDRFRVSVIGMRRGLAHALSLARMGTNGENVEIASVCDCDMRTAQSAAKRIEGEFGTRPAVVQDLREVMADKSIEGHMACTMPLLGNISYLTGRTIDFDPESETIKNDDEANRYLRKSYREPFVVPRAV